MDVYTITVCGSYALGVVIASWLARLHNRSWLEIIDVLSVMVLSAVLGSKWAHVLFEAKGHILQNGRHAQGIIELLQYDPWHWLRVFGPGYVFYGGVLFSLLVTWLFLRARQVYQPWAYADYAAPGLALGIFFGRLACFWAGCCYGSPTYVPWAIHHGSALVHPTQLYDASFGLIALIMMCFLYRKKRFNGEVFIWLMIFYSCWRFITELFRGDTERGLWGYFSTSQIISIILFIFLCILWLKRSRSVIDNGPKFMSYTRVRRL